MRHLSGKEKKELNLRLPKGYSITKKDEIKEYGNVFYLNDNPIIIEKEGKLIPHLKSIREYENEFSYVTVDKGAIPFIAKGADLMKPGITNVKGEFEKGEIILIKDEIKLVPFALGYSLFSSEIMREKESGKVIEIKHFLGDKYC